MNIHKSSILLITIICAFYVYSVHAKYDFHKLERTWIVRNTSAVNETRKCLTVVISKAAQNTTADFKYTSESVTHPDIYATLEDKNGTIKLLNDKGSDIGNIEILKHNVPYYLVLRINTTEKGLPPYMVLTGMYQLPVEVEPEITQFWNTNNATMNITLHSTTQEPVTCRKYLVASSIAPPPLNNNMIEPGNNATNSSSIPNPAAGNNGTSTVTTQRPPKSASSCVSPNFLFTVTFLHVCFYLKKFV